MFSKSLLIPIILVAYGFSNDAYPQSQTGLPEEAVAILEDVFSQRGEVVIRSGVFTYVVVSQGQTPDASEIAEIDRRAKQQMIEASEAEKDPKIKAHLRELAESDSSYGPSLIANADLKMQVFTAFSGPLIGGDYYVERRTWDEIRGSYGDADYSLVRRYGDGQSDCIWFDQFLSGKVGAVDKIMAVQQAPHVLGRISGAALMAGLEPMLLQAKAIDQMDGLSFEGQDAVKLSCQVEDFHVPGLAKIDLLVVPGLNYIVPLVQEFDSRGDIAYECRCENYFSSGKSGILFPRVCTTISNATGERRVEKYLFEPENVQLNVRVPNSRLRVQLPVGAELFVMDSNETLKAHEPVELAIDNIAGLASNQSFHKFGAGKPRLHSEEKSFGLALIWLSASAILLVAVIWLLRKRGKSASNMLLAFSISSLLGCDMQRTTEHVIAVEPVIDLKEVASESGSVEFSILGTNLQPHPSRMKVQADCSCVSFDRDVITVDGGQTFDIAGRLSLHRKAGLFQSWIRIKGIEPSLSAEASVLLKAIVITSWTASPRRIVSTPNSVQNLRLVAPTSQWDKVTLRTVGDCISLNELKCSFDENGNLVKDFAVEIGCDDRVNVQEAKVEALRHELSDVLLSIPVLIEDADGFY